MSPSSTVTVKRGSLYLGREVYDRYFAGLEAVILSGMAVRPRSSR